MSRLYSLQYLRAFAALAVVVFHCGGHGFGDALHIGAAGVDVFFVISGYVMWATTSVRSQSPREFIVNRVVRVTPMYWIMTLVLVGAATLVPRLFPNMTLDVGHTIASLLFIPWRSPINGELWPTLVQGWTLNYEMFFYVIFAVLLVLPKRARIASMCCVFVSLAILGQVGSFTSPVVLVYTDQIMLEFLAGVLLARLLETRGSMSPAIGWLCVIGALVTYAMVWATGWINPRLIVWGGPAFLLVAGLIAIERNGHLVQSNALALIGDASYSIYLTHGFTVSALGKFGANLLPLAFLGFGLVLSIVVGIAAWWIVERPVTRFLQTRLRGRSPNNNGLHTVAVTSHRPVRH